MTQTCLPSQRKLSVLRATQLKVNFYLKRLERKMKQFINIHKNLPQKSYRVKCPKRKCEKQEQSLTKSGYSLFHIHVNV
jgi:hypothetical protein